MSLPVALPDEVPLPLVLPLVLPLPVVLPLRDLVLSELVEFVVESLRLRTELDVDSRWFMSTLLSLALEPHPAASKVSPKKLAIQMPFAKFFIGTSFSPVEEHFRCHLP